MEKGGLDSLYDLMSEVRDAETALLALSNFLNRGFVLSEQDLNWTFLIVDQIVKTIVPVDPYGNGLNHTIHTLQVLSTNFEATKRFIDLYSKSRNPSVVEKIAA